MYIAKYFLKCASWVEWLWRRRGGVHYNSKTWEIMNWKSRTDRCLHRWHVHLIDMALKLPVKEHQRTGIMFCCQCNMLIIALFDPSPPTVNSHFLANRNEIALIIVFGKATICRSLNNVRVPWAWHSMTHVTWQCYFRFWICQEETIETQVTGESFVMKKFISLPSLHHCSTWEKWKIKLRSTIGTVSEDPESAHRVNQEIGYKSEHRVSPSLHQNLRRPKIKKGR